MHLRKLKNRLKLATTVQQIDRIMKDAYDMLSQSELSELESAIQAKIHQSTSKASR